MTLWVNPVPSLALHAQAAVWPEDSLLFFGIRDKKKINNFLPNKE
jgi:hypothetical protein